ncbi:MAG: thiamine phosphate synthase [Ahrensia sp.]|nr:thiamine phosphate synthase [Ahrensia sp.]
MNRCRLVLMVDVARLALVAEAERLKGWEACLRAGDIASAVFYASSLEEAQFQALAGPLVSTAQKSGVAALIHDNSRIAGRLGADGLQLGADPTDLKAAMDSLHPTKMVGASGVKTRHNALVLGELQPDYVMFGKPGGDTHDEANPKNLELGRWWSAMIEIPCIVLAGGNPQSVIDVARCGAEFVAVDHAVFGSQSDGIDLAEAAGTVDTINRLLDEHAPQFEEPQ